MSIADIELDGCPEAARVVIAMMSSRRRRAVDERSSRSAKPSDACGAEARVTTQRRTSGGAEYTVLQWTLRSFRLVDPRGKHAVQTSDDPGFHHLRSGLVGADSHGCSAPCIGKPSALLAQDRDGESGSPASLDGARTGAQVDHCIRGPEVTPQGSDLRVFLGYDACIYPPQSQSPDKFGLSGTADPDNDDHWSTDRSWSTAVIHGQIVACHEVGARSEWAGPELTECDDPGTLFGRGVALIRPD
jgi:hypothetical protein